MDSEDYKEFQAIFNLTDFDFNESARITPGFEKYIVPPLIVVIGIVGLLGNGTLFYVLRKSTERNAQNTFIFNLAIADLVVVIFFLPFTDLLPSFTAHYPFGAIICSVSESVYEISQGVSAFTLIALSAQPFMDARQTTDTFESERAKRNAIVAVVVVIWIIAAACAAPTMVFAHILDEEDLKLCLSTKPEFGQSVVPFRLAVFYVVPLIAGGFFLAVARLNRAGYVQNRAQKELSSLVPVLIAVYALCFFPSYLASIRVVVFNAEYNELWHAVGVFAYLLTIAYRCLNPVALYCVSGWFRQLFNRHLLCCCTPKHRELVADLELPLQDSVQGGLR